MLRKSRSFKIAIIFHTCWISPIKCLHLSRFSRQVKNLFEDQINNEIVREEICFSSVWKLKCF